MDRCFITTPCITVKYVKLQSITSGTAVQVATCDGLLRPAITATLNVMDARLTSLLA